MIELKKGKTFSFGKVTQATSASHGRKAAAFSHDYHILKSHKIQSNVNTAKVRVKFLVESGIK